MGSFRGSFRCSGASRQFIAPFRLTAPPQRELSSILSSEDTSVIQYPNDHSTPAPPMSAIHNSADRPRRASADGFLSPGAMRATHPGSRGGFPSPRLGRLHSPSPQSFARSSQSLYTT
ncbi:hypothetical protein B0H17DRAFT_1052378 [Mycena rosella]|uniref:Uncharacterized protein n=1 Tax=Mycena rosella TaxID=1033263 RepID=A0AAD7DQV5_MYCRO|nr:hypothetical protein B0H17DRAFT_1052378 [Mycena rosella]